MPKKRKGRKKRAKARKTRSTEKGFDKWGKRFGKRMEKSGEEFGEEMKEFGKKMEQEKGLESGSCRPYQGMWWRAHWHKRHRFSFFGAIGPFIGSIFSVILLVIGALVLDYINLWLEVALISYITVFILGNLQWFFAISLVLGYVNYFGKVFPRARWLFWPIGNAVGWTFLFWIGAWVLSLINMYTVFGTFSQMSALLYSNLAAIFVVLLVLGYLMVGIKRLMHS